MPATLSRMRLPQWCDPADAFVALFGDERALFGDEPAVFWLDAGPAASSGSSWMGSAAGATITGGAALEQVSHTLKTAPAEVGGAPIGWVGWLAYEFGAATTGVPLPGAGGEDVVLLPVDRVVRFDHADRAIELIALTEPADAANWQREVAAVLATAGPVQPSVRLSAPHTAPGAATPGAPPAGTRASWRHPKARYEELVLACQAAIHRGDAYQLCLTNTVTVPEQFDPLQTYLRLRTLSPSHHGGLQRAGGTSLLSSSPEQFLQVNSAGRIRTKPIKGTRPRGASLAADLDLRAQLEASEKERAENLMIVDLMRNDLGRVAELGSVAVTELLAVESYAQVHQLVSTVEAQLAPGLDVIDLLTACFPAGSMTGAPKLSAMRILAGLEGGPRGIYSGAFGFIARDGTLDLAMVIRSIVLTPHGASIGTGGGITALSLPAEEVEETRIKARALLDALGASDQ